MTTDFKQDLKLDLYDFEMMIFQVENCFKKQFSDHEIERIQTMKDSEYSYTECKCRLQYFQKNSG